MYFPVAEVETNLFSPFFFSFVIAAFCSTCGISGAFLLLPYQISVLGYVAPGVSATNHIFNVIACPAGVWRYAREGRLLWPLVLFIAIGTLPGVFLGALIRISFLTRPDYFKLFAAAVLLYLAWRLLSTILREKNVTKPAATDNKCQVLNFSARGFSFRFNGREYSPSGAGLFFLSLFVGLIGGIYGIGGGAIITPFLVSIFALPMHAIAGACLFATFLTSIAGVSFYALLAEWLARPMIGPDWGLGLLLGIGGMLGMYCGAAMQKYIPARLLRIFLAILITSMACLYLCQSLSKLL